MYEFFDRFNAWCGGPWWHTLLFAVAAIVLLMFYVIQPLYTPHQLQELKRRIETLERKIKLPQESRNSLF
jgi:hypothetical protein